MEIIHLIPGKSVGGVEADFCEFITYPYNNERIYHYVICKSGLHPYVMNKISPISQKIYSLSHIAKFKIPKFLSPIKIKYVMQKLKLLNPDFWLIWNILPNIDLLSFMPKGKIIFYDHGKAWGKKNFKKRNYHLLLENSYKIICASYASKRMLELKMKVPSNKITVCLNALRPSCKPVNTTVKNLNKNKAIHIGIAGRHESFKGFPLVIHAVNELKRRKIPFKLFVAGEGRKLNDLKKLVNILGLEDCVKFMGFVYNMNEFYSQIDLFICPSLRETFGLVVIEALAHGCPVIIAGVDGLPETLQDTNSGIIIKPDIDIEYYPRYGGSLDFLEKIDYVYDPYTDNIVVPKFVNPIHIADAVEYLYENPEIFSKMSKNAIQLINEKFDYDKHVNELYNILTS